VTLIQALVRNSGTCRPDAGHRGGVARSRDEGSVTELDRRGDVARLYYVGNPRGEDQRG
jgi:hypothetical protein